APRPFALFPYTTLFRSGLPLLILISLLLRPGGARNWRPTFVRVATLSVGMLLVAVPWIIRNYNVVHEVVPTATISGIAAHVGERSEEHTSELQSPDHLV